MRFNSHAFQSDQGPRCLAQGFSPRDLLHVVNQMASAVNEAAHNLDNLERRIQQVMTAGSKPVR